MKLLLLLLSVLPLTACARPPEISSKDPRIDCARLTSARAMSKDAIEKFAVLIKKHRANEAANPKEGGPLKEKYKDEHNELRKWIMRENYAVHAITKHLGYPQKERTRMWEYSSSGKLFGKYYVFEAGRDEKIANAWAIKYGLPHKEAYEFCRALGVNTSPESD